MITWQDYLPKSDFFSGAACRPIAPHLEVLKMEEISYEKYANALAGRSDISLVFERKGFVNVKLEKIQKNILKEIIPVVTF